MLPKNKRRFVLNRKPRAELAIDSAKHMEQVVTFDVRIDYVIAVPARVTHSTLDSRVNAAERKFANNVTPPAARIEKPLDLLKLKPHYDAKQHTPTTIQLIYKKLTQVRFNFGGSLEGCVEAYCTQRVMKA